MSSERKKLKNKENIFESNSSFQFFDSNLIYNKFYEIKQGIENKSFKGKPEKGYFSGKFKHDKSRKA